MLRRSRGLVVVVMVAGLAGCWSGGSSSPSSPSPVASSPVGPTWTLTSIEGQPVVAGTAVTAAFTSDDRVSGSSGCNRYMGRAQASEGSLSVGLLASTLMACEREGVMEQETRYLGALQATTRYTIAGGELRLGSSTSEASLVFTSR